MRGYGANSECALEAAVQVTDSGVMQVANPFAHLIEQLDGPGKYPVRFVRSVVSVHASSTMLYRIDFKHFFWTPCDLSNHPPAKPGAFNL